MAPYSESRLDHVELYAGTGPRYQLRIPYQVTVFDRVAPSRYTANDWMAFDGTQTELSSEQAQTSACPEGTHTLAGGYRVRGKVRLLSEGRVSVELEQLMAPSGAGALEWLPYRFNGEYRLIRRSDSAVSVGLAQEPGIDCRSD
jgi:hypothetical protein